MEWEQFFATVTRWLGVITVVSVVVSLWLAL